MTKTDGAPLWPAQGYCVLSNVLDPDGIAFLCRIIDEHRLHVPPSRQILYTHELPSAPAEASAEAASRAKLPGMNALMEQWLNPHCREAVLSTLPIAAILRERVRSLLHAEPVLFQDMLMSKNPGHRPFPLHQDYPFWPVAEPVGGVLWTALDPIDASSGGLSLAPGSHLLGIGPPIDLHSGRPQPGFDVEKTELLPHETKIPQLEPGDAIWFHPLLWHCSGDNLSGRQRRVWSSTWLPAQARWSRDKAPRHPFAHRVQNGAVVGERGWTPMIDADKDHT